MPNSLIKIDFITTPIDFSNTREGLQKFWNRVKGKVIQREKHFKDIWKNATEEEIFAEFAFCLFTPQSKAVSCWEAVNELAKNNMIFTANDIEIAKVINKVRFRNNKAKYLVQAREHFSINRKMRIKEKLSSFNDIYELRQYLVKNIKGMGLKEAGHFLRNIGIGRDLAILDRHILKNLKILGAIKDFPNSLTSKSYFEIEKKMQIFAKDLGIPMGHLDMILWCKESGGIFK